MSPNTCWPSLPGSGWQNGLQLPETPSIAATSLDVPESFETQKYPMGSKGGTRRNKVVQFFEFFLGFMQKTDLVN